MNRQLQIVISTFQPYDAKSGMLECEYFTKEHFCPVRKLTSQHRIISENYNLIWNTTDVFTTEIPSAMPVSDVTFTRELGQTG